MGNITRERRHMRRVLVTAFAVGVASVLVPAALAQPPAVAEPGAMAQPGAVRHATDHIIVRGTPRFCWDVEQSLPAHAHGVGAAAREVMSPELDATCRHWGVTEIRPAFRFGFAHPELARKHGLDQYFVFATAQGTDTAGMAADFAKHADEIAEASPSTIGGIAAPIPDDTDFDMLWGMHNDGTIPSGTSTCVEDADIDAPEAWEITTGDVVDPVVIAIIDSGVEPHVEFAGRMVPGISTGDADETDTGDDCSVFHGTHVTGIAAAAGNNALGVAGVCWNCLIMPVDVLGEPGAEIGGCAGAVMPLAEGIIWAADHGADVINMSLQFYSLGPQDVVLLNNAVRYAHDLDIVIVAATGNNVGGLVAYPALFPETVAVGGITCKDRHALIGFGANWTSNWGPEIDVTAPGDRIWSCDQNDGYRFMNGTSMATPHVSGLAALIRSIEPDMPNTAIERVLRETAVDITVTAQGLDSPGWDEFTGYGRVNAHAALLAAPNYPRMTASTPPSGAIDARRPHDPNDAGTIYGWESVEMTFPGNAAGVVPEDFVVVRSGLTNAAAPVVALVEAFSDDEVRIELDKPIEPGVWTSIIHSSSQTRVDLGYMPGDVDGDTVSAPGDILALVDALNGIGDPLEAWSTDIDRSGVTGPPDILDVIDLLNGAGMFEEYLNRRLPVIGE